MKEKKLSDLKARSLGEDEYGNRRGHPDSNAIRIPPELWDLPEVAYAISNPVYREGGCYVLHDGVFAVEGLVEAYVTL